MTTGKIKKAFLGGNTPLGFYSFFDHNYIINPSYARKLFILKGGPGVGKSTFMGKIGKALLQRGLDVEFFFCSSDSNSLDAVAFPQIGVALVDGTRPHILDPRSPGAVDEIIHLGDYWDERKIEKNKDEIIRLNREISRLFSTAYGNLMQAKILHDEMESYYRDSGALNIAALNRVTREIAKNIFNDRARETIPWERHLFASAITPNGAVNHLETIFGNFDKRIILSGPAGTGKSTIVKKIYDEAVNRGYEIEAYHCSLKPNELEHLAMKSLNTAVITSEFPHIYKVAMEKDRVINMLKFVNESCLRPFMADLEEARRRYQEAFTRAVTFINRAKKIHDEIERLYIPNMDFAAIDKLRKKILDKILSYT
ncbi:MAG: hypothetical protein GX088_02580 [Clostridia bacterium]|nr:hypothetical protein [Clostridia bacterium]